MADWTVLLKVPNGIQAEVVQADIADLSDDGSEIEFYKLGPIVDAARMMADLDGTPPKTPQEAEKLLLQFLEKLGEFHVASFPKSQTAGYFRGSRQMVEIALATGGLRFPRGAESGHDEP